MTDQAKVDAGPAGALRRQIEELSASRARVMAMANRERRDFERDLHDGVQQDLVVLAVNLQLANEIAESDPATLKRLLAEMRRDVGEAIEAVRVLARDIYPPLLTDLGIGAALRGAASTMQIPVRIAATADRYQADVEATVYFCCIAALQAMSGVRPSGRGTVRLVGEDDALMFEVTVEGRLVTRDLSELESVGTGITDRVRAVGGTATVADESAFSVVRGTIPLRGSPAASDPRPGRG